MKKDITPLRSEAEYKAVGLLQTRIDDISVETPSWLWDASGLADLFDALDRALLEYQRREDLD